MHENSSDIYTTTCIELVMELCHQMSYPEVYIYVLKRCVLVFLCMYGMVRLCV